MPGSVTPSSVAASTFSGARAGALSSRRAKGAWDLGRCARPEVAPLAPFVVGGGLLARPKASKSCRMRAALPTRVRREGSRTAETCGGGVRPHPHRGVPLRTRLRHWWHVHMPAGARVRAPLPGARPLLVIGVHAGVASRSFRPRDAERGGHTRTPKAVRPAQLATYQSSARDRATEPKWLRRNSSPPPAPATGRRIGWRT